MVLLNFKIKIPLRELSVFCCLLIAAPVVAQVQLQQPLPEAEPLPPLEELLPTPNNSSSPLQPNLNEIPGTIVVKQFRVNGSTVFTEDELTEVLKQFTDKDISFAELLQAQEVVTELYKKNGYITSGAFIPPQVLDNGVVTIEVIEGELENIEITGLNRLKPGYIRSRLEIATKPPLNQEKLLRALQLLQLDPLVGRLSAELSAGSRPGSSLLSVKVEEGDAFSSLLRLDNQRSPSVGTMRRQVQLTHGNVLGFGDKLNVSYINTDGSNSLDDLSYTFPINAHNGTLAFNYSRSKSDVIEEPFNFLDIQSKTSAYEFTYRQPIYQTPNEAFGLGLTFSRQDSETSLLDIPFPLSRGASDEGKTKISALRFFQEYINRDNEQVFALRSQFNFGVGLFNATSNEDEPDSYFLSWRGQGQYLRLLTPDTVLLLRSDLQWANKALVPIEQFSMGGGLSVRGYRQDALLADNGLFASAEIRTPILKIPEWQTTLQLTPFFDFGTVWNSDETDVTKQTISSVGLGLRLLVGTNFTARLDWGIPLVELESSGDTLQENGLYFTIEYSPF
jgi:hemolysin activation/secretion protein